MIGFTFCLPFLNGLSHKNKLWIFWHKFKRFFCFPSTISSSRDIFDRKCFQTFFLGSIMFSFPWVTVSRKSSRAIWQWKPRKIWIVTGLVSSDWPTYRHSGVHYRPQHNNKSQHWPLDAPGAHFWIGVTDLRTDGPCYRYATGHLKKRTEPISHLVLIRCSRHISLWVLRDRPRRAGIGAPYPGSNLRSRNNARRIGRCRFDPSFCRGRIDRHSFLSETRSSGQMKMRVPLEKRVMLRRKETATPDVVAGYGWVFSFSTYL